MGRSSRAVPVGAVVVGVALAVGLAAVAGVVVYERNGLAIQSMLAASRPAVAPAGQRPFEVLDAASFKDMRSVFNAHPERTRILVLLSPT